MAQKFSNMAIEDSPWIDNHDADDVSNYIKYFRGLATSVVDLLDGDDTRIYGPFLNGAQQAVERYNITTKAHKMTKRTTVRFGQLKEGDTPTTIFIIPDVSRLEAQRPVLEFLQFCMFQEIKRHPNKHALVHYIGDEANNFKIQNLDSLLTWGRGYGLRFQLYIQNYAAFRKMYGKDALAVLISETEIKLYLPNQREPETLALIEKTLGERAMIAIGRSGNNDAKDYWIGGTDYKEDKVALLN
ncbi:MAG: TraM recognition domain-containing protein, partial [Cohaesibacteraceae bacterium]|nr:TraM recognition domain-containing protein [Cohaesibacteraceae bacterium]